MMNYIFFGTPQFATIILERLINAGYIPSAVICNPDRPVGRKQIITPPPTKVLAEKYKINVLQPEKINNDLMTQLLNYQPDFFVVAAYAKIIPKEILAIPKLGSIGVHPSLLPKWRGASPIQAALLNNDKETGTTLFLLDEKMDHGPILAQREIPITNDNNYNTLSRKLAELGADLLIDFLKKLTQYCEVQPPHELTSIFGRLNLEKQDESQATYTKKFKTEDAYIEPMDLEKALKEGGEIAFQIFNKIRAFNPEPGVFTLSPSPVRSTQGDPELVEGSKGGPRRMKILEAELTPDKKLKLKKIQFEGGKIKNYID